MNRIVADLGNTRLKLARLDDEGRLQAVHAAPVAQPEQWDAAIAACGSTQGTDTWWITSVNPAALELLLPAIRSHGGRVLGLIRSAADVPVAHQLVRPHRTGADRGVAVLAALAARPAGRPGQVILCGTALTVERITPDGIWQGGAIGVGLHLAAQALGQGTAQLPLIDPMAVVDPPAWGSDTEPAIRAGAVWGAVGTVRELLTRQADRAEGPPWRVWAGGDAPWLAHQIEGNSALVRPHLVLEGLALLALHHNA